MNDTPETDNLARGNHISMNHQAILDELSKIDKLYANPLEDGN